MKKYAWPVGVVVVALLLIGAYGLSGGFSDNKNDTKEETLSEQKKEGEKKSKKTNEDNKKSDAKTEKSQQGKTSDDKSVTYVAQPGDSYTVLARDAIQTYATSGKKELKKAQIVAAETYLAQAANSPELDLGETVVFENGKVADAVKKAEALSDSELAAWAVYVPYVDFSTRS